MTDQAWPADKTIEVAVLCPTAGEYLRMRGQMTKIRDLETTTPMALGSIGGRTVLCCVCGKGQENTSATASRILERATPRVLILAGIAGGFPDRKVFRGDVVVAHTIHSFDYGKLKNGVFERRPELDFNCDVGLLQHANLVIAENKKTWRKYIGIARPDRKVNGRSSAHNDCYVASSNKVVDDPDHPFYASVASTFPEIHAVEMEAIGIAAATRLHQSDRVVQFVMIRGISDEPGVALAAGSAQRSKWRKYASEVAAAFTRRLIEQLAKSMPKKAEAEKAKPKLGKVAEIPFQTVGALPGNAPSYAWRKSDDDLIAALKAQPRLICISGEYGIGKSSTLVRARERLLDRTVCLMDCQGMSTHSPATFIDEVLLQIRDCFPGNGTWKTLAEAAEALRPVVAFDEFGAIPKATLTAIAAKIDYLVSNGIPVIICAPDPLKDLREAEVNPKYYAGAKAVKVRSLETTDSLRPLLELLPAKIKSIACKESATILAKSRGRPQHIQRLCERLALLAVSTKANSTADNIKKVIADPTSYANGHTI
jgi:nucleoside phosphorylase